MQCPKCKYPMAYADGWKCNFCDESDEAAEIERLRHALRRIKAINESVSLHYNPLMDEIYTKALGE